MQSDTMSFKMTQQLDKVKNSTENEEKGMPAFLNFLMPTKRSFAIDL